MKYLCRRGHWHYQVDDRNRCNDGFGLDDFPYTPVASIPVDMTPDVIPSSDSGPEFQGFDGGSDLGSGGAGGGGEF